jgi:UDPglucose 6-dehydrogenase
MRVTIVGSGYVGLVTGACLADFGYNVTCVDTDATKVEQLRAGISPIYEPGLDGLLRSNAAAGRLHFTTDLASLADQTDIVFIAVGTPSRRGDGHADLGYVYTAAEQIAREIPNCKVVVTKSTVPVGTGDEVERIIRTIRPDSPIVVVSNPEFLREGAAIEDFKKPDRIVIGTDDPEGRAWMRKLYQPVVADRSVLMFTSRSTAELIKYSANAFLATKITFINEIADLCEAVGADVQDVARGIGLDQRIGPHFLNAGPGYGGSCFPKDTKALAMTAEQAGTPVRIVEQVIASNESRKQRMAEKVIQACGGSVAGKTIAVLGVTFKPNTDDMRDAPSLVIVPFLERAGARVVIFDPHGEEQARGLLPQTPFAKGPYECVTGADAAVLLTEWDMFRGLDFARVRTLMADPVLVDLRNVYRPHEMAAFGFRYTGVGRAKAP